MNAWYLGINSVGGALLQIPLSGSASKGGKLLFGAVWSITSGRRASTINAAFSPSAGEVLVFTGTDPGNAANWRQEGRYTIAPAARDECSYRRRRRSADC